MGGAFETHLMDPPMWLLRLSMHALNDFHIPGFGWCICDALDGITDVKLEVEFCALNDPYPFIWVVHDEMDLMESPT